MRRSRPGWSSWGAVVTVVNDVDSTTSQTANKDLIVISSTVQSADVGTKFVTTPVPVIVWGKRPV